jgi:hypothetical protein
VHQRNACRPKRQSSRIPRQLRRLRFSEDLEDVFPHIPFPAQHVAFAEAVRLGREIRVIETFARQPGEAYRAPDFVRVATQPRGP